MSVTPTSRGMKIFLLFVGVLSLSQHLFVIHVDCFSSLIFIKTTVKTLSGTSSKNYKYHTRGIQRLISSSSLSLNDNSENNKKKNKGLVNPYLISSSLSSHEIEGDVDQTPLENQKENDGFSSFEACLMQEQAHSPQISSSKQVSKIINTLQDIGFTCSQELLNFVADFEGRPEVLSKILQKDFELPPLLSHQLRAALLKYLRYQQDDQSNGNHATNNNHNEQSTSKETKNDGILDNSNDNMPTSETVSIEKEDALPKKGLFKSMIVNPRAKRRHEKDKNNNNSSSYGLPKDFSHIYPKLSDEISKDFQKFMILPMATHQEVPIREATATVYLRHARLFLGWYLKQDHCHIKEDVRKNVSIYQIIPDSSSKSVQPIIDFILWLRKEREISHSYEANLLRGLSKLLKFRFVEESQADPTYGEKSYQDIAAIREMRKLHKNAQNQQLKSPRSSEEEKKWISWEEYLSVVKTLKADVDTELSNINYSNIGNENISRITKKRIATKYQYYLLLAFMSCVPDRQRTFRELVVGKTFVFDEALGCWTIRHGPEDYKTGKTYGERPPLILSANLTPSINDFYSHWRPCLQRPENKSDTFFLQPSTGNPMTRDSIYNIVSRCCLNHAGKKTNPHLLRDMVVTHVRSSSTTSEQQLEALALYMGHSITMQRDSYDRRTMHQKVAPAVELLQSVNEK